MKKAVLGFTLALALVVGAAGSASALTMVLPTQSFEDLPLGNALDFTFDKFNQPGYILTGVLFELYVNVDQDSTGTFGLDNETQFEQTYNLLYGYSVEIGAGFAFVPGVEVSEFIDEEWIIPAQTDGDDPNVFNADGDDYRLENGPTVDRTESNTVEDAFGPANVSQFQGPGTFDVELTSSALFQGFTGGVSQTIGSATADGDITVTYTYEESEVPVPAAVWLLGSGLLGLVGLRKRLG